MIEIFTLKQNDTSPSILYAILPADVDLTGASVVFSMRNRTTGVVKINRAPAVIVTATITPTVRYDWAVGDTDTAGDFEAEFEVTYSGGAVETFPNDANIIIRITDDIV